jgi:hypothetical protein
VTTLANVDGAGHRGIHVHFLGQPQRPPRLADKKGQCPEFDEIKSISKSHRPSVKQRFATPHHNKNSRLNKLRTSQQSIWAAIELSSLHQSWQLRVPRNLE